MMFLFQLLLCVGDFFGKSPEAEAEWEVYKSGAKKGIIALTLIHVTFQRHGVLEWHWE